MAPSMFQPKIPPLSLQYNNPLPQSSTLFPTAPPPSSSRHTAYYSTHPPFRDSESRIGLAIADSQSAALMLFFGSARTVSHLPPWGQPIVLPTYFYTIASIAITQYVLGYLRKPTCEGPHIGSMFLPRTSGKLHLTCSYFLSLLILLSCSR